jgi:hypothetical protein
MDHRFIDDGERGVGLRRKGWIMFCCNVNLDGRLYLQRQL